jgi:RNA polymerase sigma-70 factor (ECF subfamily)
MASSIKSQDKLKLFKELMAYQESVFRICLGFSKNPWDAEELAQDVYLRAYQKIGTLKDPNLARAWLFRIAKNICIDQARKKRSKSPHELNPNNQFVERKTPESLLYDKEQLQVLKEVIRQLPAKLKEVLVLRAYAHLSYQEISSVLKIKEGTVMSRLNLARQAVMSKMRRELNEK